MADSSWDDYEFYEDITFENSQTAGGEDALGTPVAVVGKSPGKSPRKRASSPKSRPAGKQLKLSDDVNNTLVHVNKMIATDTIRTQAMTSSELGLRGVLEVQEMTSLRIRGIIERMILETVSSVFRGEGFGFLVPSRSNKNQMYIKELDRIVLKDASSERKFGHASSTRKTVISARMLQLIYELCLKNIHVTKRDLFYTDVKLFEQQSDTDSVLEDLATMVGCTRTSLRVVAAEKGVVVGRLQFVEDGDEIDCTKMGISGKAISACHERITNQRSDAKFVLLIEKDAAFMRLAEDRFYNKYPCILITAKGQPDVATRLLLRRLRTEQKLPVLGLVDADPYGLKILSVYMSGSKNMSYDSISLTTPDIKWLGVRPSDQDKYKIPAQCRLPLTPADIKAGKDLLEEDFIKSNPDWEKELAFMIDRKEKAEIQALSTFGFQYLTEEYLPRKLREGDWI